MYHCRRKLKNNSENNDNANKSKYKFRTKQKSSEELIELKKKFKEQEKNYNSLQAKFDESSEISENDDSDLRIIFSSLNSSFSEINRKLTDPICYWTNCNKSHFETVNNLQQHIFTQHIISQNQSYVVPSDKCYKCHWEHCVENPFKKQEDLKKHILVHTGKESDVFIKLLIADQAKALVTPSKRMRWHPMFLKFCLANYKSETSYNQLRNSGFF